MNKRKRKKKYLRSYKHFLKFKIKYSTEKAKYFEDN